MHSAWRLCALSALVVCAAGHAHAFTVNTTPLTSSRKDIESLGTGIAIALPLVAGGIALYKHDRVGLAQLAVEASHRGHGLCAQEHRARGTAQRFGLSFLPVGDHRGRGVGFVIPVGPLWLGIWPSGRSGDGVRLLQPGRGAPAPLVRHPGQLGHRGRIRHGADHALQAQIQYRHLAECLARRRLHEDVVSPAEVLSSPPKGRTRLAQPHQHSAGGGNVYAHMSCPLALYHAFAHVRRPIQGYCPTSRRRTRRATAWAGKPSSRCRSSDKTLRILAQVLVDDKKRYPGEFLACGDDGAGALPAKS